jgi:hypothetical protein
MGGMSGSADATAWRDAQTTTTAAGGIVPPPSQSQPGAAAAEPKCACVTKARFAATVAVLVVLLVLGITILFALNTVTLFQDYRILFCALTFSVTMLANGVFGKAVHQRFLLGGCCRGCSHSVVAPMQVHLFVIMALVALSSNALWYGWPGRDASAADVSGYAAVLRGSGNEFFVYVTVSWLIFELGKFGALVVSLVRFRGGAASEYSGHGSEASPGLDLRVLAFAFATMWINPIIGAVVGALLVVSAALHLGRQSLRRAHGLGEIAGASAGGGDTGGSSKGGSGSTADAIPSAAAAARAAAQGAHQEDLATFLAAAPGLLRTVAGYTLAYAMFVLAPGGGKTALVLVHMLIVHTALRLMGPDV